MAEMDVIEHFVVLMLENRSFDNLLGSLYPKSSDFEGVDGSEANIDRTGKVWLLTETAGGDRADLSVPSPDPGELWKDINLQLFGAEQLLEGVPKSGAIPTMKGFVDSYTDPGSNPSRAANDPSQIMQRYNPDRDLR